MAIEITHVRFGNTKKTEDEIVRYKWKATDGSVGNNDKPTMVAWAEKHPEAAHVGTGADRVNVRVVRPTGGQPYLQTHADGKPTNNLVNLPTF